MTGSRAITLTDLAHLSQLPIEQILVDHRSYVLPSGDQFMAIPGFEMQQDLVFFNRSHGCGGDYGFQGSQL